MLAREQMPAAQPVREPRSGLRYVPSLYQVALLAILGAILVVGLAPRLDTDFWWHLKDGQYIAMHHVVPSRDFMSYTFVGHAWTDHEWLAELLLYGLYSVAGLWGPIVFFAAAICAAFALVYLRMIGRGINQIVALFILAPAFMASSASWGPRIQMLSLFFLSAYSLALFRYRVTRDRRLLAVFPLLMLLWTNIHGGFVLGLVVMALTVAGEWLNLKTGHDDALSMDEIRALGIAFLITFAVTIVNPNTVRQLLYPLTFVLPNAYTNLIEESASPNFHMPVMMVFEGMLLLLISSVLIVRPRVNWTYLLLVLAFTHLSFSQVRNVPLWCVVVSPILAEYVQALVARQNRLPRFHSYQSRPVTGRLKPILNLSMLAMVALLYLLEGTHYINASTLRKAETDNYPTGAIAYMRSHHLPPHVFVSYAWGGYLLWNLFPTYRDFMDSRADTLYNTRHLRAYLTMYSAAPGWKSTLKTYGVQDVLVERKAPLAQALAESPGWTLRYRDAESVLYTRSS